MKKLSKYSLAVIALALTVSACKKEIKTGNLNTGDFPATETPLKDAASFPVGVAINYGPLTNEPKFLETVKRDFDQVVMGYEMKHGAIVQSNGSYSYANADAMIAAVGSMDVYGHTLMWHQNQNATYLKSFAGITIPAAAELSTNGNFEGGQTGWSIFNTNGATITWVTGDAANAHGGNGYMKVVNPTAQTGNQWKVQVSSAAFATTPGKQYIISYWVRAASPGGSIRLSSGPTNAQYQGDQTINTTWQQVTWTITANLTSTTFLFDMGQVANTYYIDDVSVKEVIAAPSGAQIATKVDQALNDWITNTVNHFKSKVRAWDVVNEPYTDGSPALRNNSNTSTTPADVFVWTEYLGRFGILKAFNYAKAADPTAEFYINDYNLESNSAKLDSVIALAAWLKTNGAKVDGIGTQMHVNVNASYAGIDKMFQKLAATGLKIRVSELDVRLNPVNKPDYASVPVPATMYASQADMYMYIVKSYIANIPAAQRAGITVWGVNDKNSWLYSPLSSNANVHDYPLLYNDDYARKPAYSGFIQALKGQ